MHLSALIQELRKQASLEQAELWKNVAELLEKPTRQRRIVNIRRLNTITKDNEIVVVPGKVLGDGDIDHKLTIAAFNFSGSAVQKLLSSKCDCMTIHDLLKKNPKAKNMRIIA